MDYKAQPSLVVDLAGGLAAGLFANWATDLAQGPLRRATPEGDKRREARVSPGASSEAIHRVTNTAPYHAGQTAGRLRPAGRAAPA